MGKREHWRLTCRATTSRGSMGVRRLSSVTPPATCSTCSGTADSPDVPAAVLCRDGDPVWGAGPDSARVQPIVKGDLTWRPLTAADLSLGSGTPRPHRERSSPEDSCSRGRRSASRWIWTRSSRRCRGHRPGCGRCRWLPSGWAAGAPAGGQSPRAARLRCSSVRSAHRERPTVGSPDGRDTFG